MGSEEAATAGDVASGQRAELGLGVPFHGAPSPSSASVTTQVNVGTTRTSQPASVAPYQPDALPSAGSAKGGMVPTGFGRNPGGR